MVGEIWGHRREPGTCQLAVDDPHRNAPDGRPDGFSVTGGE